MDRNSSARMWVGATFAVLALGYVLIRPMVQPAPANPAKMQSIGTVDERFQSYNIEMVEVTGGMFWRPYSNHTTTGGKPQPPQQSGSTPAGMDPNLFQYRVPIDLSSPRLRKLAVALGPAYVRVSGTWANNVYFQNSDSPVAANALSGFSGVLTRGEWKGVIDFSRAVNAEIVTSFATGPGTRNAKGVWTPKQALVFLVYTKSAGGSIAAAEFMNEPTYAIMGGAPKGYDAAAYGRDIAVFRPFLKQSAPEVLFLGPGSVGEGPFAKRTSGGMLNSEDLLKATGPAFDVFSYHLYAGVSKRCASTDEASQTIETAALSKEWLAKPEEIGTFYAAQRDKFEPGTPLWITETADAACGGNPWASTFLDTFRYLVEHARLAQLGVKVIMHNTLASSDYGLLDENTFMPRPDYWAALLWRKLMGPTVLKPELSPAPNIYAYAHCLQDHPTGVALLVINADQKRAYDITLPVDSERYSLTAKELRSATVQLNGETLQLNSSDDAPQLIGEPTHAGHVSFAPVSITFLAIANANNGSCS